MINLKDDCLFRMAGMHIFLFAQSGGAAFAYESRIK